MTRTSPYQGLVPYSEEDADWFFGREGWREIIVDNLRAYRVSILYGASGVGKSSVLGAGVVRYLREHGEEQGLVVVPFSTWSAEDPVGELRAAVGGSEGSLADAIVAWASGTDRLLLLVLDQFEEYFLYHGDDSVPARSPRSWRRRFAAGTRRSTCSSRSARTRSRCSTASKAEFRACSTT